MIPGNTFTPTPIVTGYSYPDTLPYDPLSQTVNGGIALNDGSMGRTYQFWNVSYDSTSINVKPLGGAVALSLTVTGVLSVSLAFDTNMQPVLAWTTTAGAFLRYYNAIAEVFDTLAYPAVSSCRVAVDDPAPYYAGASDVVFGYTLGSSLYYRQQRDRYTIAYLVGSVRGTLQHLGLNLGSRLQFQVL